MSFTPLHYDLCIKTVFPATFYGTAELSIDISEPTHLLSINTADPLQLLGTVLVLAADPTTRLTPQGASYDEKKQTTTLEFGEKVLEGKATLGFCWWGRLDDNSSLGYYRIANPSDDDEEEGAGFYAVTQFQPALARRAFPCIDHIAKKATFSISLISPKGLTSLSNTPQISQNTGNGSFPLSDILTSEFLAAVNDGSEGEWETVTFEKTPPMSTYIVAWAVGEFSSISSSYLSPLTNNTIPLRMLAATPFGHIERGMGQLALDTLAKVMPLYERMFDIPYALGKLDMLACDAFDAGAMENWGLIMGRTSNLLFHPLASGLSAMFKIVGTVSHEAAHQWFGNAVTPMWWDNLWLNEGFATLMGEVIMLEEIQPDWQIHSAFIKFHRSAALDLDALRSTHPVQMECADDLETTVNQSFDSIAYEKGSAILKMLASVIGEEMFVLGTSKYLKSHLFGNTVTSNLWKAMSEVSGIDVEALMLNWTTKPGFPVITVKETDDGLLLRQNRFLATGDPTTEEDSIIWPIPLSIEVIGASASSSKPTIMSARETLVPIEKGSLYVVNSQTSGTYRVSYPASHVLRLAEEASKIDSKLSVADRLGILQDAILLAEAGYTKTSSALTFISKMVNESVYLVWGEIAFSFRRLLDAWWEDAEMVEAIKAFARNLWEPLVDKIGFSHRPEDTTDDKLLRVLAVAAAATAEVPAVIAYLQQAFMLLASGQSTDPTLVDLAVTIVSQAVQHGGEREYNIALAIYNQPPTPQHQLAAIAGLTGTRSPVLIQQTIALFTSGKVAEQNMAQFLGGLAVNPISKRMVWQLVQGAWPILEMQFQGSMNLGNIVRGSFQSLSSEKDALSVEAFFANKDTTHYNQGLQLGLETVRGKARWIERDDADVRQWLREHQFWPAGDV